MNRLEAIRARADAATAGPWWWDVEFPDHVSLNDGDSVAVCFDNAAWESLASDNAAFIAAARADVPALLAVVEAARSVDEVAMRLAAPRPKDAAPVLADLGTRLARLSVALLPLMEDEP